MGLGKYSSDQPSENSFIKTPLITFSLSPVSFRGSSDRIPDISKYFPISPVFFNKLYFQKIIVNYIRIKHSHTTGNCSWRWKQQSNYIYINYCGVAALKSLICCFSNCRTARLFTPRWCCMLLCPCVNQSKTLFPHTLPFVFCCYSSNQARRSAAQLTHQPTESDGNAPHRQSSLFSASHTLWIQIQREHTLVLHLW